MLAKKCADRCNLCKCVKGGLPGANVGGYLQMWGVIFANASRGGYVRRSHLVLDLSGMGELGGEPLQ